MNNPYHPINGFAIYDRADYDVKPLSAAHIDNLMSDDEDALLLEPTTLEDVEHTYLGEHLADAAETAMFEAVSTTKQRLAQTMRAFVRVLNRGLNGTGITAGTHDAGTDETGLAVVGGAQIGNVRKVSGVPVMAAKIPCTDGQSVSLIFHSPTSDGNKLAGSDALVAFKFLLNKRDVTHVVAPIGGRDMSLDQTAQSLANLIERNSAKFQKQQDTHKKLKANAESAEDEANKLESQAADEMAKADALRDAQPALNGELDKANSALARVKKSNADLEQEIAAFKAQKKALQAYQGNEAGLPPTAAQPDTLVEAGKVKAKPKRLAARAYEVVKGRDIAGNQTGDHGKVMMAIEGEPDFIAFAGKHLDKTIGGNADYQEDGKHEGEIAYFYVIDRSEKAYFMQEWKSAKSNWQSRTTDTPPTDSPIATSPAPDAAALSAHTDRDNLKAFVGASRDLTDAYDFYRWFYRTMGTASGVNPMKRPGEGALSMDDWMARLQSAFPDIKPEGDVEGDQTAQQAWFNAIYSDMFPVSNAQEKANAPATTGNADDAATSNLFFYGMKARPDWKPRGAVEQYTPEESANLAIVKHKEIKQSGYRWGVVAYAEPLSQTKIDDYELVDFQSIMSPSEAKAAWQTLNALIANFKRDNPDATDKKFIGQYIKTNAPDSDKLSQEVKDAGGAMNLLRVMARADSKTTVEVFASLYQSVPAAIKPEDAAAAEMETAVNEPQEQVEIQQPNTGAEILGQLVGWADDLVNAWAEALGYDSGQLDEIAGYVSEHASPEYLKAVEKAMVTGKPIPMVKDLVVAAEPDASAVEEEEGAEVSEADKAAKVGIEYLTGLLSFQSGNPAAIDAEMAKVEDIAAALANAGKMDENEDLLNQVADHLVALSVAIAQGAN